jgi:hypothetical protein
MNIDEVKLQLALGTLSYGQKIKLSKNKRTSKKILTILSKDKNYGVRWNVANNPNTPIEVLTILSKDKYSYIRYNVGRNPSFNNHKL